MQEGFVYRGSGDGLQKHSGFGNRTTLTEMTQSSTDLCAPHMLQMAPHTALRQAMTAGKKMLIRGQQLHQSISVLAQQSRAEMSAASSTIER